MNYFIYLNQDNKKEVKMEHPQTNPPELPDVLSLEEKKEIAYSYIKSEYKIVFSEPNCTYFFDDAETLNCYEDDYLEDCETEEEINKSVEVWRDETSLAHDLLMDYFKKYGPLDD